MNQKTNVIKKNDFERYEIILPFTAIAGRRKKQFLCSELEKMHPCFSDEYSFDSAMKKICKKGIKTDVMVMSKFKLAEYEGQRRFAGTGFLLEKKAKPFYRYFFMSAGCKGMLAGLFFSILIGILGIICGGFLRVNALTEVEEEEKMLQSDSENLAVETDVLAKKKSAELEEELCLANPFFDAVNKANGSVDYFEWELNGFVEKINAAVHGIFPESFNFLSDGQQEKMNYDERTSPLGLTVSYENKIPSMSLSHSINHAELNNTVIEAENRPDNNLILSRDAAVKNLREIFFCPDITLIEERTSPLYFEMECQTFESAGVCLCELQRQLGLLGWSVGSLFVRQNENKKKSLRIGLFIEESIIPVIFDLTLLAECLSLFVTKTPAGEKAITNAVYLPEKNKNGSQNTEKTIGEIKRADNSIVIFYKDSDGKLVKRIEKQEVKR